MASEKDLKEIRLPSRNLGPMIFILLDELVARIATSQEQEEAKGDVESFEITVTDSGYVLQIPNGWRGINVINDGPDDVYVSTVAMGRAQAPIKQDESLIINIKKRSLKKLYLWTKTGASASVRIFNIV